MEEEEFTQEEADELETRGLDAAEATEETLWEEFIAAPSIHAKQEVAIKAMHLEFFVLAKKMNDELNSHHE